MTVSVLLASTSPSRRRLLENAGVAFEAMAPDLDEDIIKQALFEGAEPVIAEDLALILARAKTQSLSSRAGGRLIVGADQVLGCGDQIYGKPASREQARDQFLSLRGKAHVLHTAVVCADADGGVWEHVETARLVMRDFSNEFLGQYLALVGDEVTETAGGYKIEGPGIQLFSEITGDYHGILGLPLLPLLAFLREHGVMGT